MQSQRPILAQKQEQRLSPQLIQGIKLLGLPLLDLRARIEEELEANPALEVVEDRRGDDAESLHIGDKDVLGDERAEYFENSSDSGFEQEYHSDGNYDSEDGDTKRRFMEGVLTRPESLQDHLIWQLRLQPLPDEFFQVGELLIRNLDENGFHREPPETLVPEDRWPAMREVMAVIQGFEPAGTCVADYRESLVAQARQYAGCPAGAEAIIREHLEALDKGKFREVARKLGLDEDDVAEAFHFVQQLDPFPGRRYSAEQPQYVIPDLRVVRRDGEFVVLLNEEEVPELGINPFFSKLSHGHAGAADDDPQLRSYIQGRIRDARGFIRSIRIRNENLVKVAYAIVHFQQGFFLRGPRAIAPLVLRDVAEMTGVTESTVSRLTNGKYVQTEWGLYELKYFFSSAVGGTDGGTHSKESVKQMIREIVTEEGGSSLSDQRISDMLAGRGVKIARRTVTKYRKELDIDSSYGR